MEFELISNESAIPCLVVADPDNGRYMIRDADTSGEVFNSNEELLQWVKKNWSADDFKNKNHYNFMLASLNQASM
ncbi:hypothetical protein ACFFIX_23680 [Metabacillus herbersteinensis]|uniref:Threonine dehydratase n=1 Tax=Metabacillus herbersteinensis TaxID=283816 RepID=A0ABV6GKZ0_9BACI